MIVKLSYDVKIGALISMCRRNNKLAFFFIVSDLYKQSGTCPDKMVAKGEYHIFLLLRNWKEYKILWLSEMGTLDGNIRALYIVIIQKCINIRQYVSY